MGFGKHASESLRQVIDSDRSYVDWCLQNVDGFAMTDEAFSYFRSDGDTEASFHKSDDSAGHTARPCLRDESDCEFEEDFYDNSGSAYDFDDADDGVNWEFYDDNLDMDQQSEDFWN